jgi:hypothetical protein
MLRCGAKLRNRARQIENAYRMGNAEQLEHLLRHDFCQRLVSAPGKRCRLHGGASTAGREPPRVKRARGRDATDGCKDCETRAVK